MIVMKFGGTSVESAAAIERVAGIVQARATSATPWWWSRPWARPPTSCSPSPPPPSAAKREEYIRQLHDLRDYHSREARLVVPLSDRADLDRILDEHFQELTELVKGLAVLGELTPRSIDAISSYGERLSSYIVTLAFRHFGMPAEHVDSRDVHRHRPAPHAGRAQLPRDLRAAGENHSAARRAKRGRDGRLHRVHRRWRHHHARPRRLRLHRVHRGRGHRRRRDPDLDRRRRHAHRRPHHPARRPSRQDHLLRRSRGTGVFRRQGAASGHRGSGHREQHPGADSQFAPSRRAGHAHRRPKPCTAATW